MDRYTYTQSAGVYYLYDHEAGGRCIYSHYFADRLMAWARERGIRPAWRPFYLIRWV
jgi:hypothetical protein